MIAEAILDCARTPLTRGINLVEASAGTGKTYAIGMLVLRAVTELGIPIDQILVVTFTKAATEELRSRIRQRLAEARNLLTGGSSDDATINAWLATVTDRQTALERLRQALGLIDRAGIFTIHSFCLQMLTEQALESGQLFDVELLADVGQVRTQLVEDFWRSHLYPLGPRVCGIVADKYPTPAELAASIMVPGLAYGRILPDCVSFDEATTRFEECFLRLTSWWQQSSAVLYGYFLKAQEEGQLKKALSEELSFWWDSLSAWFDGEGGLPKHLDYLPREGLLEALNGNKFRKRSKDDFLAEWPLPEQLAMDVQEMTGSILLALRLELAKTLRAELQHRLQEQGHMSFDDLIVRLDLALANEGEGLKRILGERFAAALIDEFQDTDSAQWRIFSTLFGGGSHYLYLIGDPKQAIYRFRGADIFSYFTARSAAHHQATLAHNYRSHPLLVNEVNNIFSGRVAPFCFPDDALPFHPVLPAKSEKDGELFQNGERLPVMVYCQLAESDKDKGRWSSGKAAESIREYVVAEVCRLLDHANPVTCRKEKDGAVSSTVLAARDIAVLVRSNHHADEYLQAFARAGVPAVVGSKKSVFETEEAKELLTLLAALATPGDMFSVKRAMTISWFGLTGNDLLAIWEDESAFDDRFNRFLSYHQGWQEKGFLAMMNRLLADEDVYLNLARAEMAERRIANIHHLLELVQETETAEKFRPDQTLVWLRAMIAGKSGDEDRELRLESDEQAVRIVTMHSAKGLQYPIVFCPFLWYRSDREQRAELVSCHEEDGLVIDLGSAEIAERRLKAAKETLAEDLRLAYVALTRAELCCYTMWADVKPVKGRVASSHESALGYLIFPDGAGGFPEQQQKLQAFSSHPGIEYRLLPSVSESSAQHLKPLANELAMRSLSPGERTLVTNYQMSSYSAMASLSEQEDHGAEPPGDSVVEPGPEILHPGLPAGASFGNLIHDALELFPFHSLASGTAHGEELARLCRRYGMAIETPTVQAFLATIVTTPLLHGEGGFALAQLDEDRFVSEMPFYFHMERLDTRKINDALSGETTVTPLSPKVMQGYLTGFVDLFCEHDGKFYILDYKTNFLGGNMGDYRLDRLISAMASHNYGLQYWIYTLVLHRYLANVLPGYSYKKHFGGVLYLFVRGLSPALPGNGVYAALPSQEILTRLDTAVGGGR